ncbi:bcl2-associated agonist of cell death [Ambystoma mexicanum]|uniref:bcl2-associated agonist of cell death n=1 Tax=Ambystoma mexicanum TaxID=8296 RepID=UPI0037E79672
MATTFHIGDDLERHEFPDVFPPGFQEDTDSAGGQLPQRHSYTSPDLQNPSSLQMTSSGSVDRRDRPGSDPSETPDEAVGFRSRSKSAPPILWVATRYGRELRRMSDEFDMSFQGFPRPKSAGYTSELKKGGGWTAFWRGIFGQSRQKEDPPKPN